MTNCANGAGYANTLIELGTPPDAAHGGGQPFISPDLGIATPIVKSGYSVNYTTATNVVTAACTGTASAKGNYLPSAEPHSLHPTGSRHFRGNEGQTTF